MSDAERMARAWNAVLRGEALGLKQLAEVGAVSPKYIMDEATRLLEHPQGCPDDVKDELMELRRKASAQLQ